MCLIHGYVPESFTTSIMVPIPKNKSGNCSIVSNYRPISLITMFSKIFKICIDARLTSVFNFDDVQYGFATKKGRQAALFTFNTIIDYFVDRGHSVNLATLDASKAFDRINHNCLFIKLIENGLLMYLLKMMINRYLRLNARVRWENKLSDIIHIKRGIRQGAVTSPKMFNLYFRDLVYKLRDKVCAIYAINLLVVFYLLTIFCYYLGH